jgi:hypothetical protein
MVSFKTLAYLGLLGAAQSAAVPASQLNTRATKGTFDIDHPALAGRATLGTFDIDHPQAGVEARQASKVDAGAAIENAQQLTELIKSVGDIASGLWEEDHEAQANWVRDVMRAAYAKENGNKNVLIFHDQASNAQLNGGVHQHYELSINKLGGTKGFEVWVFDDGTFERAGDGGYSNWGFTGCFEQSGSYVKFKKTSEC